jgi:hypothetical protein
VGTDGDLRSSINIQRGTDLSDREKKIVFGERNRNGKGKTCPSATCCGAVSDRLLFIEAAFRF